MQIQFFNPSEKSSNAEKRDPRRTTEALAKVVSTKVSFFQL